MHLGFNTEKVKYAEAALLLYAMYKSREKNSALNGMETWTRCQTFIRAAVIKSTTLPEFIQNFSRKAGIAAINPHFLQTDGLVRINEAEFIKKEKVYNYRTEILENDDLLDLFTNDSLYLIMLVRERIQREREKFLGGEEENENEDFI